MIVAKFQTLSPDIVSKKSKFDELKHSDITVTIDDSCDETGFLLFHQTD